MTCTLYVPHNITNQKSVAGIQLMTVLLHKMQDLGSTQADAVNEGPLWSSQTALDLQPWR